MDTEPSKYTVQLMPNAQRDLTHIHSYIAEDLAAPAAAARRLCLIEKTIMLLQDFPRMGPACQSPALLAKGYRKLIIKKHIAFYTVDDTTKTVTVMRIILGTRNYEALL